MSLLSEVAEIIMGQSPPSESYNAKGMGLPFYQGKTDFGFQNPTPKKYCSDPKKVAKKNDILISVRAPVGPTNICQEKSCIGRGIAAIRANTIHYLFLYYNLKYIEEYIASLGTGSTFKAINKSQLENLEVNENQFKFYEQKKVAHILSTVQRAIEQQERLIQVTTELKKGLMHKLFTEGTRGETQKETEIGLVPESWEVVRLGKYAKVVNGFAFKSKDYVSKGVRVIRISNVSMGYLIDKDDKYLPNSYINKYSEYSLQEGDLILSLTRPIIKDGMKYCFIEGNHLPALLNQRVGKFEITSPILLKNYLYHIVFSPYFVNPLRVMAEGSNQPNVSPTRIENFLIPIPRSIEEQKQIGQALDNLTNKINNSKKKIITLNDLFRTLLHQLMTAQIRAHELEFEGLEE